MDSSMPYLTDLPDSLLLKIFKYLSIKELCQGTRQVCKQFHDLSYDFSLWRYTNLSTVCDMVTSWEIFCDAFSRICNHIEELNLINCAMLLKSDENILWGDNIEKGIREIEEDTVKDKHTTKFTGVKGTTFYNLHKINFGNLPVDTGFIQMLCILCDQFPSLNAIEGLPEQETCSLLNALSLRKGSWRELHYLHAEYLHEKKIDHAIVKFVEMNSNLRVLSLENSMIDDSQILQISKLCPNLEKLNIPEAEWIVDGLKLAAPFLRNIYYLNISNSRLSDETFCEICKYCTKLKYVNISNCYKVTEIGITKLVTNAKYLESLILNDNSSSLLKNGHLTNVVLEEIGKYAKNLTRLQIAGCSNISSDGLYHVANGCRKIRFLDIRDCLSVTDEGIISIANNCGHLEELNAYNCTHLTSRSINKLIVNCKNLHSLELGTCHYLKGLNFGITYGTQHCNLSGTSSCTSSSTGSHIQAVTQQTCSTSSSFNGYTSLLHELLAITPSQLSILDLSCCSHIANDSIKQIAGYCSLLKYINLRCCSKITDQGVIILVQNCKLLQALNIAGSMIIERSRFTDACLLAIGKYCENLVMLDISKNPLLSLKGISHVVTECSSLKRLRLTFSPDNVKINEFVKCVYDTRGSLSSERFRYHHMSVQDLLEGNYSNKSGDFMIKFPRLKKPRIC